MSVEELLFDTRLPAGAKRWPTACLWLAWAAIDDFEYESAVPDDWPHDDAPSTEMFAVVCLITRQVLSVQPTVGAALKAMLGVEAEQRRRWHAAGTIEHFATFLATQRADALSQ